jgi:selenocysteine lyase/cysteine desulfurase
MTSVTTRAVATPAQIRHEFPVFEHLTYLDVASRAPMADRVSRELRSYIEVCQLEGARKDSWVARTEEVRARAAALISAAPSEIAFMKNTSDGLNTIAAGLGLRPGDNVVVCPEFEHANNIYPWQNRQQDGLEVRFVPMSGGVVSPDRISSAIDARTRVVTVSAVSSMTGGRADIAALAEVCRPNGIFLMVDAAQSLGVVHTDVRQLGADGLAAATQKGLLGMYGLGLLYCRADWQDRLRPPFLSVPSVERSGSHESDLGDIVNYRLHDTAARFETGNHNFAGLFAFDAALSLLTDVGTEAVERHVTQLASSLVEELTRRGYPVITPTDSARRAGIVAFDTPDVEATARRLEEDHIRVAVRRGHLRVSLHAYNNEADLDRLFIHLPHLTGAA